MSQVFTRSGIRFEFPANWKLEFEDSDGGWSASVFSPETAFAMVSFHPDEDDPARLADFALDAMRENYTDIESEFSVETMAGVPSVGYDVGFFALDLTNSCWIRCFAVDAGCILVLCQCTDEELHSNALILHAIRASITIEDEG